jgi:hypothetical protein
VIQGEALRVKTLQTAVEHREELARLGEVRAREQQAQETKRGSEDRFWREVSRAVQEGKRPVLASPSQALDRAREAGRLAGVAHERLHVSKKAVVQQLGRALRLEARAKALSVLQRREKISRLHQREERLGEEVQAVMNVGRNERFSRPIVARACRKEVSTTAGVDEVSQRGSLISWPATRDAPGQPPLSVPENSEHTSLPIKMLHPVSPRVIDVEMAQAGRELRIVGERAGTPFSCRVIDRPGPSVDVVVETVAADVSMLPLSTRLALAARLRAVGVQVHRLEVKRETPGGALEMMPHRRRNRLDEDADENGIT